MKASEAIRAAIDNGSGINAYGAYLLARQVERAESHTEVEHEYAASWCSTCRTVWPCVYAEK